MTRGLLFSVSEMARRFTHPTSKGDGLVIEPMRRRHVRAILEIEEQVYPKPWTAGVFTSEIDQVRSGNRYYVVGLSEGVLVGYGGLMFVADEAHITNIAVEPSRRRRGFARQLLAHLVETAIDREVQALTLEVRVSNEAAIGLYREFGFAPAGIRQKYYENTEDALVMWAHDVQSSEFTGRLERSRGNRP